MLTLWLVRRKFFLANIVNLIQSSIIWVLFSLIAIILEAYHLRGPFPFLPYNPSFYLIYGQQKYFLD